MCLLLYSQILKPYKKGRKKCRKVCPADQSEESILEVDDYQLALLVKSIGEAAAEEQQVLVAALDLQVFTKRMKAVHKVAFDDFIDKTVEEYLQSRVRSWRKKNQALC